jgi:predicted nucleic acid-binding Zn ribbon protein
MSTAGRELQSLRRRRSKPCEKCGESIEMLAFQRFCSMTCHDKWHGQKRKQAKKGGTL